MSHQLKQPSDPVNSTSSAASAALPAGLTTLAYVRKLDGLYQNLEERVRRLEEAIHSEFGADEDSLVSASTFSTVSAMNATSLSHPRAPATRKISKSDLDDYCLPLLQRRATPTLGELNSLAMAMKTATYHHLDTRAILSRIREWFRRKREYMSQRVMNVCQRRFPPASLDAEAVASLLLAFSSSSSSAAAASSGQAERLLREVAKEANLEVTEEASLLEFTREKCIGYLENLQLTMRRLE